MMLRALMIALCALLGATGVLIVNGGNSDGETTAAAAATAATNATAVLRSSRTAQDVMPAEVAASPLFEGMGVNPATSRRLARSGGPAAWALEASDGKLCFISGGSAGCAPATVLSERGLFPEIAWRRRVLRVEGIAADSVDSVLVTFQDDSVAEVPVRENTFLLTTTSRLPRLLAWSDAHGAQSLSVSLPSDLLDQGQ
jgi:hypothetical protein